MMRGIFVIVRTFWQALAMNCVGFKHKCNKKFEGHVCDDCQERWREGLPVRPHNTPKRWLGSQALRRLI